MLFLFMWLNFDLNNMLCYLVSWFVCFMLLIMEALNDHNNLESYFFMKTFSNFKSLNALWMQYDLIMNSLEANEWVIYDVNLTRSTRFWMQFDVILNAFDSFWANAKWLHCEWVMPRYIVLVLGDLLNLGQAGKSILLLGTKKNIVNFLSKINFNCMKWFYVT